MQAMEVKRFFSKLSNSRNYVKYTSVEYYLLCPVFSWALFVLHITWSIGEFAALASRSFFKPDVKRFNLLSGFVDYCRKSIKLCH